MIIEVCQNSISIIPVNIEFNINYILFQFQIPSTKYVEYLIQEVVPLLDRIDSITKSTDENAKPSTLTLDILRTLSELLRFGGSLEGLETKVGNIFKQLLVCSIN